MRFRAGAAQRNGIEQQRRWMKLGPVRRYPRHAPNQCQPLLMAPIIPAPRLGGAFRFRAPSGWRRPHTWFVALPWRRAAFTLLVLASAACNGDEDVTGSTNRCANDLFKPYHPKVMEQCIAVCRQCERGTITTCSTSCNLKGAR
jgi:hypothetical protein